MKKKELLQRHREVLAALVEAVGRGDEVGLPEAYRAAVALLKDEEIRR